MPGRKAADTALPISTEVRVGIEATTSDAQPLWGGGCSKAFPLISIVVPTFNRAELLPETIDSIVAQTYSNWELIIVDDGSTDDTQIRIARHLQTDSRICCVSNSHRRGPSGARNQGLDLVEGEYVAFLDSDDLWKPHHLESIMRQFTQNNDVDWIYADSEITEEGECVVKSVFDAFWSDREKVPTLRIDELHVLEHGAALKHALDIGIFASCQGSVLRRKIFDVIRFDEDFRAAEDWLLLLRVLSTRQWTIGYLRDVHFTYRAHAKSISGQQNKRPISEKLNLYKEFEKLYRSVLSSIQLSQDQRAVVSRRYADLCFRHLATGFSDTGDKRMELHYLARAKRLEPRRLYYWLSWVKAFGASLPKRLWRNG